MRLDEVLLAEWPLELERLGELVQSIDVPYAAAVGEQDVAERLLHIVVALDVRHGLASLLENRVIAQQNLRMHQRCRRAQDLSHPIDVKCLSRLRTDQ